MARRYRLVFLAMATAAIVLIPLTDNLLAQSDVDNFRGPGGYLSWSKMLWIALIFLLWVRMADWINRDSMKIGERIKLRPEIWNPIVVFTFLIGFLAAISIPTFLAGFPIYLISAWVPFLAYFFIRRFKLKSDSTIAQHLKLKPGEVPAAEALPQDEGVQIDFKPAGEGAPERQSNLIRARQTGGFNQLKELIKVTLFKRTEQLVMDFTRDAVGLRILVDGTWHAIDPMDRETGDAVLASLKYLAGLNPAERRARQAGEFSFKSDVGNASLSLTSQGVPSGERALLKYSGAALEELALPKLGMFPEMVQQIQKSLNKPGITIVSAPPGAGLTSSWRGTLATADRLTRDCVALIHDDETESVLENIVIHRYNEKSGKKQIEILRALLLTQPDMIAVPKIEDSATMDLLTLQVTAKERSVVLRTPAKSAAEAILRVYALAEDRNQFLQGLKNITSQRLLRRLCSDCRVEVRVQPKVIEQLGGDPKQQSTIFNQWKLPPPEQRVDEKGKEIEFPPCETCGGLGYIGRIAVFEMISVNDELREFIRKNPKAAPIEQEAVRLGKQPLASQTYRLVLLGVTSLAEAQRVLKEQPSR